MLTVAYEQFTTKEAVRLSANCGCVTEDTPTDGELDVLIDQASDVLARATDGEFRGRTQIVGRPCRRGDGCYTSSACGCGCGLDGIPIPGVDPEIDEVTINGDALNANSYTLHWGPSPVPYLVRVSTTDRPPAWPGSQKLFRPATEDDTFAITWTFGEHIDHLAQRAAIELVCAFASADQKSKRALPKGTVAANVNNVSVSLEERTRQARSEGDSTALGQAMAQFVAVHAASKFAAWSPESSDGWVMSYLDVDQP